MAFELFGPSHLKNLTPREEGRDDGGWNRGKKGMKQVKDVLLWELESLTAYIYLYGFLTNHRHSCPV